MDRISAASELDGDEARNRGLADSTLACDEDDTAPCLCEFTDQFGHRPGRRRGDRWQCSRDAWFNVDWWGGEPAKRGGSDHVESDERHHCHRQSGERDGDVLESASLLARIGLRNRVAGEWPGEKTVDDQGLVFDAELVQFLSRRRGDRQCATVRAHDEHHGGCKRVLERVDRCGIDRSVVLQAGEWTETTGGVQVGA